MVIDPKQTRDYTGETLDIRSRTHVRKELDRRMSMEPWNRWWVKGMNYVSRAKVAYELTEDLHQWWFGRNGEEAACFSFPAVMEEVDYYLPKCFWKHKRKKNRSSAKVCIDPDWDTFADWQVAFPETIMRLANDYQVDQDRWSKVKPSNNRGANQREAEWEK